MNSLTLPAWEPQVEEGSRILVIGASGGIGTSLATMLLHGPACVLGAHRDTAPGPVVETTTPHTVFDMQAHLSTDDDCRKLVDDFVTRAGGIDGLVVLSGLLGKACHWMGLSADEWERSIQVNLNIPFYLARAAMEQMSDNGSIILTGTESALHGGSQTSFPYGIAKRGTECLVQGLAREAAPKGITVNGLRMGFIKSGTHERHQGKTSTDMIKRAQMVPLKRGGEPDEAAALITYLLSGWARFITGQMIPLTGGDWL